MKQSETTAALRFTTVKTSLGFRFVFYCSLCGAHYESDEAKTNDFRSAHRITELAALKYFNRCHICGQWVCDEHYNEDTMRCVECSPLPGRLPATPLKTANRFCRRCRFPNDSSNCFCSNCGAALR